MKRIWKKEFSDTLWFMSACFVLGMTAGVIFANLAYPYHTGETETMALYVMQQLKSTDIAYENYFWHLLLYRGERILLVMAGGMTAVGGWIALGVMLILGILFGTLSSLLLLQFGLQGFLLLLVGLLPQILLYVPATLLMLSVIYYMKGKVLKKQDGNVRENLKEYFAFMGICLAGYVLGIVLEGYLNLPLLRLFVKRFHFS